MPTLEPPAARCLVFAFKEGLLSAVGHDVKLSVERLSIEAPSGFEGLSATFDAASLKVVSAVRDGRDTPGALSDKDKRTIEGYVRDDILHSRQHPKITFRATAAEPDDDEPGAWQVTGDLTLHGRTRSVAVRVARSGDRWTTRVRLHQPDFGITPFRALLGALKIQPHVEVELSVPADAFGA